METFNHHHHHHTIMEDCISFLGISWGIPMRGGNPQVQEMEVDHNEDMYSMHNSDLSAYVDDRKYRMLEERLKVVEEQGVL